MRASTTPTPSSRWRTSGRAFGWRAVEVDGHDHLALLDAFTGPRDGRPTCVIAHTVKGKGVSFMEDRVEWHHKVPTAEQIVTRNRGAGRMSTATTAAETFDCRVAFADE